VHSPTRRPGIAAAALLAALSLLVACGDDPAPGPATGGGGEGFPRTITHHKGETVLDHKPERIVALDLSLVGAVVSLERPLVAGVASYSEITEFPSYLGDAVAGTEEVGPLESPDLEAIAALEPDLIVSASVRHDALYDELSAIAPTVFVETTGPTWKDNITLLARALGEEARAAEVLDDYQTRATALGAAINESAGDPQISVVRFLDGPTRLYANDSFSGIILEDMGLARPPDQDVDEFSVEIGEEQIRMADGDYIFVTTYAGGEQSRERFLRNPLWRNLDGVRAGNVYEVDDEAWMTSVSLQGAHLMMDELAGIFEVEPMRG
jgi:iron-siderophore transport system substrate-binding protein